LKIANFQLSIFNLMRALSVVSKMQTGNPLKLVLTLVLTLRCSAQELQELKAHDKLDTPLVQVEHRLEEESCADLFDPNSLPYLRATGERPARSVSRKEEKAQRVLTLQECLRLAFANSNEIKQTREQILAVGGSRIIANSRFLPTVELISQYEHIRDLSDSDTKSEDAYSLSAKFRQRILESGKDNPIDINLREEQRQALFNYENRVASIFSQVRRAFLFIKLKEQQIAARRSLLEQFEKQAQIKQQRMDAGNLSVKIEVLTAKLNVLNEKTVINTLERQRFNQKMELLRLVGLPVGADLVEFEGQMDSFGLDGFNMEGMIDLSLAQSSELALAEALVAEGQRTLDQLRYEYIPDLRFKGGYQDKYGKVGTEVANENDTWGLDLFGQPQTPSSETEHGQSLGLYGSEVGLSGPEPGWFAGLQMRIPLFEGRARQGRRIEARAALASFKAALDDQRDRVELNVRQKYKFLTEQQFQVQLAQEGVNIEKERFSIKEQLRDVGKITDDELETFRRSFFAAQDNLFSEQEIMIQRQEDLRLAIRYFK